MCRRPGTIHNSISKIGPERGAIPTSIFRPAALRPSTSHLPSLYSTQVRFWPRGRLRWRVGGDEAAAAVGLSSGETGEAEVRQGKRCGQRGAASEGGYAELLSLRYTGGCHD
jgi:hypothetical protein